MDEPTDRRERTFDDFEGYEGGTGGDVVADHDAFGLLPSDGGGSDHE